ncbi:hypothetical protein M7I_2018 [Glarea lozoyensis 74030]|uniref:Uncharacterized protein n=1 Tax=Glarea lozoyensis (strain ATCC 74030 / MF5533) TaxID=1104152 RepID=H0EHN4_GLAL7|nr:hypothetical protein M7I_2018 [Glarea lozoyensis 74030]
MLLGHEAVASRFPGIQKISKIHHNSVRYCGLKTIQILHHAVRGTPKTA